MNSNKNIEAHESPAVLVTGGAGYIGSHACKALSETGFLPVTYDNLERGHAELVKWGPLVQGDLHQADRLADVFKRYRPVAVMHFAALAYVGESVQEPEQYFHNNVGGTKALLQAMKQMAQPIIIFSSTCATYGDPVVVPMKEDHIQVPVNPYGETKLQAERAIAEMNESCGFRNVNLRYFNAAGADPDGQTGELHDPETHLIPLALQAANGDLETLQIFGADYPTPDGTCIRDYIHVTDLVSAHLAALNYLLEGGASDSFNLANGKGFSVKEVVDAVEKVTSKSVPRVIAARRAGDPPVLVGDASRARSVLGWEPQITSLEAIVGSAWDFENSRKGNKVSQTRNL